MGNPYGTWGHPDSMQVADHSKRGFSPLNINNVKYEENRAITLQCMQPYHSNPSPAIGHIKKLNLLSGQDPLWIYSQLLQLQIIWFITTLSQRNLSPRN